MSPTSMLVVLGMCKTGAGVKNKLPGLKWNQII